MSVVLVALPGAPTLSEEAQKRDKEVNQLIEIKVQGELFKNTSISNL